MQIEDTGTFRFFDVIYDEDENDKHYAILEDFIERGFWRLPFGGTRKYFDGTTYKNRRTFLLEEEVADEYIRRMSE